MGNSIFEGTRYGLNDIYIILEVIVKETGNYLHDLRNDINSFRLR